MKANLQGLKVKELLDNFEEVTELIEVNKANNFNFCIMGGLDTLMGLIVVDVDDELRKAACRLFSSLLGNNIQV